jgi:hypothetical protein
MRQRSLNNTNRLLVTVFSFLLYMATLSASAAWAGPPFITDDPETVEYQHGEFYIASQYANNKDGTEGTLPHFELNYGVVPDVQLHLLIPLAFVHPDGGPDNYGLGDTEVGVKFRFIHERDNSTDRRLSHRSYTYWRKRPGSRKRSCTDVSADMGTKELGAMDNLRRWRLLD